ncbi:MAG: replication initiation protein [Mycoplasmataceae bacterium]|nr:replication initiation protein [Mycoplasmataceae bacterium]
MNDLVIYHNDFNQLKIPITTELEQNLLMGILVKIKNSQNEIIEIYPSELRNFFEKNLTDKEIATIASLLRQNFFKTDFTFLIKDEKRILYGKETINLFNSYKIFFHDRSFTQFSHLELKINETFKYLVNELTKDFTEFELLEFIGINGKYAKTLYRLLKQFRNTGNLSIFKCNWQDFCDIMQIPNNYTQSKIDEKILKPAIKELSAEPNLFTNEKQTIFKNLSYKKIKDPKSRGRGGKVIGIEFTFDKETKETNNKSKKNKSEIQTTKHIEPNLDLYVSKLISTEFGNARILNVEKHNNKIKVTYSLTKSNEIKSELFNSTAELEREIEHAKEKNKDISIESFNNLMTKIKF